MANMESLSDAEAAQSQLLARVRTLVEHSQEGVFVYKDGRYLYVNSIYAHMLGHEPDDMIGEAAEQFFVTQERPRLAEIWEQRSRGRDEESHYETRLLYKDGQTEVPVSVSSRPVDYLGEYVSLGTVRDRSAEQQSQSLVHAAENRLEAVMNFASVGLYRSTPDGRLLSANLPLAKMFGYESLDELYASVKRIDDLYVKKERRDALLRRLQADGSMRNVELRLRHRDGREIWLQETARLVRDEPDHRICYEGMLLDITERKAFEKRLRFQASHDPLTGLSNRLLIHKRLTAFLAAINRENLRQGALLFINLSAVSNISKVLGPYQHDYYLRQAAKRLFNLIGNQGEVSRHEGSVFVVLAQDITQVSEAESLAKKIETAFYYPFSVDGFEIYTRLLTGIVLCHPDYESPDMILRDAGAAMMECKHRVSSGSGHVFFDDSIRKSVVDRLETEAAMRIGLERGEFNMYYQPVCEVETGRVVFLEALLRWRHPAKGLLEPAAFLSIAEEADLLVELGWRGMREVMHNCASWQSFAPGTSVAFNLSHQQFYSPRLRNKIVESLEQANLPASLFHVEVTEAVFVNEMVHAQRIMDRLHALGVRVYLDDFGTGYSSLSYLNDLPIDALKIDRRFVSRLTDDKRSRVIAQSIVNLAHELGLEVVAEGVERKQEADLLVELGCELAQGYYFGIPMDASSVAEYLKTEG